MNLIKRGQSKEGVLSKSITTSACVLLVPVKTSSVTFYFLVQTYSYDIRARARVEDRVSFHGSGSDFSLENLAPRFTVSGM